MQFHQGKKKQTKKPQDFFLKFIHEKHMKLKYLEWPRKKTIIVSSWSQSHSLIDTVVTAACLSDILNKYKSLATSYKCRLCSHSLQQSRCQYTYSFFSHPAKPTGGFKQLLNKLCMSLRMATKGMVLLHCSYFCDGTKNPKVHSNFEGCTSKFFLFSLSVSFLVFAV